ncbi:MAG: HD domain-containing phosphohydrolase [Chloroflexota bacterium]
MTVPVQLVSNRIGVRATDDGIRANQARLELLYEISRKISSTTQFRQMVRQIIQMTQHTFNAAASSVLLFSEDEGELFFETAAGPASSVLREITINSRSGIAGWVARNGKPLIVNDVAHDNRFDRTVDKATGFATKSIICVPMIIRRRVIGVIEVINKLDGSDFTQHDLDALLSVGAIATMVMENSHLHQTILDAYKNTIKTLASAIDAKDPYTRGHSERVMEYAMLGGLALSLDEEQMENLEYAAILHDVGKIVIDDSILKKPDSLTPVEWSVIQQHPVVGADMLDDIPFLEKASQLVRCHHERFDGSGYPAGIAGDAIPLGARIIAVADAFDTMTTDRAYRHALTVSYTISELVGCTGTQFCPRAVEAFLSAYRRQDSTGGSNYLDTSLPGDRK